MYFNLNIYVQIVSEKTKTKIMLTKNKNELRNKVSAVCKSFYLWYLNTSRLHTRVTQKVLSLRLFCKSYRNFPKVFYCKPSTYSPFTESHFCNLRTQSRKVEKIILFMYLYEALINGAAKRKSGFIFPESKYFSFGDKKKSQGLRSGEHAGWLTTVTYSDSKKS